MALISPILWQGTPYDVREAALDFYGAHDRWHTVLSVHLGPPVPVLRLDDLPRSMDRHNKLHQLLARQLGIPPASDLSLYDLHNRAGWALFHQIHAIDHERLRVATGL